MFLKGKCLQTVTASQMALSCPLVGKQPRKRYQRIFQYSKLNNALREMLSKVCIANKKASIINFL